MVHKADMAYRTSQPNRYTITYAFNGYLRGESTEPISRIREAVTELQDNGASIEFLGATQRIDSDGHPSEITARYEAPTKGFIAWLNWQAQLPACGQPQDVEDHPPQSDNRNVAAADTEQVES